MYIYIYILYLGHPCTSPSILLFPPRLQLQLSVARGIRRGQQLIDVLAAPRLGTGHGLQHLARQATHGMMYRGLPPKKWMIYASKMTVLQGFGQTMGYTSNNIGNLSINGRFMLENDIFLEGFYGQYIVYMVVSIHGGVSQQLDGLNNGTSYEQMGDLGYSRKPPYSVVLWRGTFLTGTFLEQSFSFVSIPNNSILFQIILFHSK